jgi:hypothetical protein
MSEFRTEPPWGDYAHLVPTEYEIVAEFPSVVWGWECDLYQWILRAPDGELVVGGTSHGSFYVRRGVDAIRTLNNDIEILNSFIEDTQRALRFLS